MLRAHRCHRNRARLVSIWRRSAPKRQQHSHAELCEAAQGHPCEGLAQLTAMHPSVAVGWPAALVKAVNCQNTKFCQCSALIQGSTPHNSPETFNFHPAPARAGWVKHWSGEHAGRSSPHDARPGLAGPPTDLSWQNGAGERSWGLMTAKPGTTAKPGRYLASNK